MKYVGLFIKSVLSDYSILKMFKICFKHFKNWITATQRGNKLGNPWWCYSILKMFKIYFKHFKNWIKATQRGNKWGNPWWWS